MRKQLILDSQLRYFAFYDLDQGLKTFLVFLMVVLQAILMTID
jgi:hypothetical protein